MKKPAILLSLALVLSACSLLDEGSEQPNDPDANSAPTVQLTASPQTGPAPLTVALDATATDPDGDTLSYRWSLADVGRAATATTVFNEVGTYPITVTVSDGANEAQASTTVTVTGEGPVDPDPTDPEPPTTEPQISIRASPSGPAPWAVRYDYAATGYPEGSVAAITCNKDGSPYWDSTIVLTEIDTDAIACLHLANSEAATVTVRANAGPESAVLDTKVLEAEVQPTSDVPFAGTWQFTSGEDAPITFMITEPTEFDTGGRDATGEHEIIYRSEDDAGYIYLHIGDFTLGDTVESADLAPLEDGTQRFVSSDEWDGEPFVLEKID